MKEIKNQHDGLFQRGGKTQSVNSNRLLRLILAGLLLVAALPAPAAETAANVPPEVAKLAGTYSGSWTMFGIDRAGEPVRLMAWTDVMKAENPRTENGRALVTTTDEMSFEGRAGQPVKLPGKEGYTLSADGSLKEYFIETAGQQFKMMRLASNIWTYATPATSQDLGRMGFPGGASGEHVVVKVTGIEKGIETHRITRLTTVTWKGAEGQERSIQFISLQGVHRRQG